MVADLPNVKCFFFGKWRCNMRERKTGQWWVGLISLFVAFSPLVLESFFCRLLHRGFKMNFPMLREHLRHIFRSVLCTL